MWVRMRAGRRGYGRSGPQSGTALIRRGQIASKCVTVGMPVGLEHKQTLKDERMNKDEGKTSEEMAVNDQRCLMPKENGGEVSSEKGSEEAVWSCQGDGGGEEMLQLKGTQREKIMEKHFSPTQSKAGGEEKEDGMER